MSSPERILTLDLGNSVISGGVWEGERLVDGKWVLPTPGPEMPSLLEARLEAQRPIDRAILGSVVPSREKLVVGIVRETLDISCKNLTWRTLTGMKLAVCRPSRVGPDRIANAVAAYRRWGGPVLAVDIGTAVTCDAVSAEFEFLGGAIAPGPRLGLRGLSEISELLPLLEPRFNVPALGRDTEGAMLSGVCWGTRGAVEFLVARIKKELNWGGRTPVAVTGGYAPAVLAGSPLRRGIDPLLTLRGLRQIAVSRR